MAKELERRVRQSEQDKAKSQAGAFGKYEHTFLVELPSETDHVVHSPKGIEEFKASLDAPAEPWETKCVETRTMTFRVTSGPGTFAALSIFVAYPSPSEIESAKCAAFREVALTEGSQSVSLKVPVVALDKFNVAMEFKDLTGNGGIKFFVEAHVHCRIIMK